MTESDLPTILEASLVSGAESELAQRRRNDSLPSRPPTVRPEHYLAGSLRPARWMTGR